jgi:hypothetical protein
LSVEDALNWARQRAPRVYVRLAVGDYHSAGSELSDQFPTWPPDDPPAIRRRRPPEEDWKDRTEADAPILWLVEVWLTPPEFKTGGPFKAAFARWEATVGPLARAAGAEGWDDDEIKSFFAYIGPADGLWVSHHRTAYRLWFSEQATRQRASEQALRRCPAPQGWALEPDARPA